MSFRWGTVTGVDPLRVRLDGDSVPLPFTPQSLANVLFGDRVRCEISGGRVIVHGRAGGSGPIGEHLHGEWALGSLPSGCVLADGAVLAVAAFPRLAAHYAATYGAANFHGGNGSTTFAVPDTRERTYVNQGGADVFASLGGKPGTKTHTLTVDQIPAHTHGYNGAVGSGFFVPGGNFYGLPITQYAQSESRGGGQPHPIVQPSFVCRVAIRAR